MQVYRIKDWDRNFEVSQSRKAERPDRLSWVAVPNRHDGRGYRRLVRMPNGVALYGAWHMILQVASKCPTRGTLADSDGPMTAWDIADKCSVGVEIIEDAIKALLSKEIGWLEYVDAGSALPLESTGLSQQDKQDKTEQDKQNRTGEFERFWEAYPRKVAKPAAAKAWKQAVCKAEPEAIIAAAAEFATTPKGQAGEFCPHPATWLNQSRWQDDRREWYRERETSPSAPQSPVKKELELAALKKQQAETQRKYAEMEANRVKPGEWKPLAKAIGKLP